MKSDKFIDKTNEAIRKQAEIKDLIYEIKQELIYLKKDNQTLKEENSELRRRLLYVKSVEPKKEEKAERITAVEDKTEVILPVEEKEVEQPPISKEIVVESKEQVKDTIQIVSEPLEKEETMRSVATSNLYEFFLGKNIIAKIASVL